MNKAFVAAWLPFVFLAVSESNVGAQEWTRFRGPNGTGVSEAKTIPTEWSDSDFNWKVKLPGVGHAHPVVWKDRIFVPSAVADGSTRILSCLAVTDGKMLWEHRVVSSKYKHHANSSMASSTPTVDADGVYVAFSHPDRVFLTALNHNGKVRWTRDVGEYHGNHGFGASPILHEDKVIFPNEMRARLGGEPVESSILALDRLSGEVRCKTSREASKVSYGTPCIYTRPGGTPQIIFTSTSHGVVGVNPEDGKPVWEARVLDKRAVSSPIFFEGLIFGSCGSGGGGNYLVAVRSDGTGDVTDTHLAYRIRQTAPYVPTSVVQGEHIFLWSDKGGIVSCLKAATGDVLWRGRAGGTYFGSPVWVNGRLFCVSQEGEVVVVAAGGDKFEVLARNALGETCRSTPAVAGGRMYVRTEEHLVSVGGRAPVESN